MIEILLSMVDVCCLNYDNKRINMILIKGKYVL